MQINRILVPIDFSDCASKAVEMALSLAEHYAAEVVLVHVMVMLSMDAAENIHQDNIDAFFEQRRRRIEQKMHHYMQLERSPRVRMRYTTVLGASPADALIEFVDLHQSDVVVMGSYGETGLPHYVQGSVAEKMVRLCPVPVIAVHGDIESHRIKRVLVPIDFSAHSERSLALGIELARKHKATIGLIHVVEKEILPSFYGGTIDELLSEELEAEAEGLDELVRENLYQFADIYLDPDVPVHLVIRHGVPHQEIVDYTCEQPVDLLVIATHGLTDLEYLLIGSTAEKVIRWAHCSVMTIK